MILMKIIDFSWKKHVFDLRYLSDQEELEDKLDICECQRETENSKIVINEIMLLAADAFAEVVVLIFSIFWHGTPY